MDLLASVMGLRASTPAPDNDFWYQPVDGLVTAAGAQVTAEGAQKVAAWYRGRDILASSLAMLPLQMYRRLPNDEGRERAPQHPLADVLHRKPNGWQDAFGYKRQAMYHLIDYGNAYAFLRNGPRGFANELWPVHPTLVRPEQMASGAVMYHVRDPKTHAERVFGQDDLFHLRGASDDGIEGKGILQHARESLGLGLVLETYASKLFSRGSLQGGIIEVPGAIDKEAVGAMARSWKTSQGDWHMPRVVTHGAKYQPTQLDPEKAQMILSRKFSVNDIARWLGLPPHMLGDLDRASFSNIEHQGQEFVTHSLGSWLSLWEFAINDQLVLRPETYFAEFVRDALVRGDIATRWQAYVASVNSGIVAPNEVRAKENLRKLPGLDQPREPQNITGRGAAGGPQDNQRPGRAADPDDEADARVQQLEQVAEASARRVLRKEIAAVSREAVRHAADMEAFAEAVTEFYARHVALVVNTLQVPEPRAREYCAGQASQIVSGDWVEAVALWGTDAYAAGLAGLALEEVA